MNWRDNALGFVGRNWAFEVSWQCSFSRRVEWRG